ncbi:glycosyltransferase family 2 protein [Flavobacteriaceae bacterium]|nr:glycosyltransferase family 2 protein [Flavobacteriaceae bacterium]MDC1372727.1 glycosyltransferase family 2 protein [Flavobacteriaceae bacterium]
MTNPTIVVLAYNRQPSLNKLLNSLSRAEYGVNHVNLVISIDYSGLHDVYNLAEDFNWEHGEKIIIKHEKNLGLRHHVLYCGDLSLQYQSVIILEDDLLVSPSFYLYVKAALEFYKNNSNIAGISLYHHEHNESTELPFEVIDEGYDTYFMKVPCSWGQLWTATHWEGFRSWYEIGQQVLDVDYLPDNVIAWPETSWKKYFYKYLIENNTFFVYPKKSFTTNSGAIGEHHSEITGLHQASLSIQKDNFKFPKIEDTINVYDQFFEICPDSINSIENFDLKDIEIDVFGTKPIYKVKSKYILSSKVCKMPIRAYKVTYYPINLNVLQGLKLIDNTQAELYLGLTQSFENSINPNFIDLFVSRTDKKIKESIENGYLKQLIKTDIYRIGHRLVRVLKALPFNLGSTLLKKLNSK